MANKTIRSSQVLSPFGIGQIVNFPQEVSLMICGLNRWDQVLEVRKKQAGYDAIDEPALRITEPRLQKMLGVNYFLKPFVYKTSGTKNRELKIPAVRFPKWHYCTNSKCGSMREVELTLADDRIECLTCSTGNTKSKFKMIPVRFVAVCPSGHIQDVPFKEWVHDGAALLDGNEHYLSYHTLPGSGDLGSIMIKCSCGSKRTLAGLMNIKKHDDQIVDSALARIGLKNDEINELGDAIGVGRNLHGQYCKGHRPWLGLEGINNASPCNRHLQVLIRGGSNVHFSDIVSALHLPEVSKDADELVVKLIEDRGGKAVLRKFYEVDDGVSLRSLLAEQSEWLIEKFMAELFVDTEPVRLADVGGMSDHGLRFEEYQYILEGRNSENTAFKAVKKTFEDYDEADFLRKYFDSVVLVEKLKETRVFRGFSRIAPGNMVDMSELSTEEITWLPAIEVYGEGIFLKFKDEEIDQWLKDYSYFFSDNIERYKNAFLRRRPHEAPKEVNASFILLHTFAHLLIKKLCFQCGYGSSSLRERLYFSSDSEARMNGILIYTSSGDSEGSLGGLVRQGRKENLGKIIMDAVEDARWCSADPVCSDIGHTSGQGPDNVNGSACHNCCIVPETSCEEFNMLLDRATVVGSLTNDSGYFKL